MIFLYLDSIRRGLESLAFDSSCIVCGDHRSQFCDRCRSGWSSEPRQLAGEEFPVCSSITYGDTASSIVLLAKESGVALARDLVARELQASIEELLKSHGEGEIKIHLVPIPSSRSSRIRRGGDFIAQMSAAIARNLNSEKKARRFTSTMVLSQSRRVMDQSGLSEIERHQNLSGAFKVANNFKSQSPIIVVDDVITTGTTLREAVRALKERNLTVLGAATACASRRRLPIR